MINSSVIALLVILVLLVGVIILIAHKGKPRLNKAYFNSHWEKIERNSNYSAAIINADALIDQALKMAHVKGATLGERLHNAAGLFKNVNAVWWAHKLRNRIVHEPDMQASAMECQKALRLYKQALKDLGAL